MEKTGMVGVLGESALLIPRFVNGGLAANDRVKYRFTLLQTARAQADSDDTRLSDLATERRAAGVDEPELDGVVAGATLVSDKDYAIPHGAEIVAACGRDVEAMLEPLRLGSEAGVGPASERVQAYEQRLHSLREALPSSVHDRIPGALISQLTHAQRDRGDSLHLLVADLHKELNQLQTAIAVDSVSGASVYGLEAGDAALVAAFMRGLNATAPLKFDHPGLATTATRAGERVVIQNDIGTTDAHVLVVHVEGLRTTLTYTDIHLQRARFFLSLFRPFGVSWQEPQARQARNLEEGELYYLCVGVHEAADSEELERYLAFLGSRIVFLIDWNRARKRLRTFVPKRVGLEILKWAAERDIGQRGFLELGGERLIHEAIEYAAPRPLRYGARLDELLGKEAAAEYLRFVFQTAKEGLLGGRSRRQLCDEIKAELLRYFRTPHQSLLVMAERQATLVVELANAVERGLASCVRADTRRERERLARRAARWERQADELVVQARRARSQTPGGQLYAALVSQADDAADGLEEALFLLTLWPFDGVLPAGFSQLKQLGELLVEASQEYLKLVANAAYIHRGGAREDLQDFLGAADHVVATEHATDDAQRQLTATLVQRGEDFRSLHLMAELARALEEAADALSHAALKLRDHVMNEVMIQ